jgi:hypothetical protein
MWSWADRMVKAVSNVTVGTVIVLVHVALADRDRGPAGIPSGQRVAGPLPRDRSLALGHPTQPVAPPQRRITN